MRRLLELVQQTVFILLTDILHVLFKKSWY